MLAHLAEFLSICVRDEGLEGLEASIDALHAPPLVAVGDLTPDAPLLVPLRLRSQWNVGQAADGTGVGSGWVPSVPISQEAPGSSRKGASLPEHCRNSQIYLTLGAAGVAAWDSQAC